MDLILECYHSTPSTIVAVAIEVGRTKRHCTIRVSGWLYHSPFMQDGEHG